MPVSSAATEAPSVLVAAYCQSGNGIVVGQACIRSHGFVAVDGLPGRFIVADGFGLVIDHAFTHDAVHRVVLAGEFLAFGRSSGICE